MSPKRDEADSVRFEQARKYFLLGLENFQKNLYVEAERFLFLSFDLLPERLSTLINLSAVLIKLEKLEEAQEILSKAINLYPTNEILYLNLGNIFAKNKNWQMSLNCYDKAISFKPDFSEAYSNRGIALQELEHFNEALASYDCAIDLQPRYADAYNNRGEVLRELNRLDDALASFDRAIEINPEYEYLLGIQLHSKMLMCDWQDFETIIKNLFLRICEGKKTSPSFSVLALTDSLLIQRHTTKTWINDKHPFNPILGVIPKFPRKEKIKIGYYSEDFREHPVSYLTVELFEIHDKNTFELVAFYYGPQDSSNMHKRVSLAFNKFIDIRQKSDKDVAKMSRDIGIDIAIDLTGLSGNERMGIFAYRAAPIQLSYIGYLGTMGAEYYDYLIADKTTIPVDSQHFYTEKIVYLPSYQVNDSTRVISDKVFEKVEFNLPSNAFVFCCFNNNYKITPPTFDGWMRILIAVPDSALFLYAENKWVEENLKSEASKRGVSHTRLLFGSRIERSEYLARYRLADLFLDTLPYNAGATASDALWAGLPVLTCMGESFASRVAASLLNAIGLPELITTTQAEYEAKAIELATNPVKLKAIKDKLDRNRSNTLLFDSLGFTKNIEAAYLQMYERYHSDLPPDHIYIDS